MNFEFKIASIGNVVFIDRRIMETLIRMKYVLCSVRKGNTNNMMEKNGCVKFCTWPVC